MVENSGALEALLHEDRTFPPSEEFRKNANISDPDIYRKALEDPEGFWSGFADELEWFKKWDQVLDWKPPFAPMVPGRCHQRVLQLH